MDLASEEIGRYSRQMILPQIGISGQQKLKNGSVLIVGMGGLGCPAAMYIVAAGLGKVGLVDYDVVEISNLHRQVLHSQNSINVPKVDSAITFLSVLNSSVALHSYKEPFVNENAIRIIKEYDVILDCTDNAATRYLLNDACVLTGKPLVSGSALRFEGQMTTYNWNDGPCYRCLFPSPPPKEFVTNCSDGGVIGAVPGIIGSMQALEVIKIICDIGPSYAGKLLMFDGLKGKFTDIKLRGKQEKCAVCGTNPTITSLLDDYAFFCGSNFDDKDIEINLLSDEDRLSPKEYKNASELEHVLIDVRDENEYQFCSLPSTTLNIPFKTLDTKGVPMLRSYVIEKQYHLKENFPVFVVCRRGNDSQRAVILFKKRFDDLSIDFKDIKGGLHGWTKDVDSKFPLY